MQRIVWLILLVLGVGIAMVFALLNTEVVSLHLLFRVFAVPVAMVVLLGILLGAFFSLLLFIPALLKLKLENYRLYKLSIKS